MFLVPSVSAASGDESALAIIFWTYNEKIVRTNTPGSQTWYVLAIPSIIASDISNSDIDSIMKEIESRDLQDEKRSTAPLTQADDAVLFDTSHMTLDEVVQGIYDLICRKLS